MRLPVRKSLFLLALVAGCASATDRLEEGVELQNEGRYFEAAYKYADAIDKDDELVEAQERFLAASDTAVTMATASARRDLDDGRAVDAANHYLRIDELVATGRGVGMRVPLPATYRDDRVAMLGAAFEALVEEGLNRAGSGDMRGARSALVRARRTYATTSDQRGEAIALETDVLLDWAEQELRDGRYRSAFGHAEDALALTSPPPEDVEYRAYELQTEALDFGTLGVAVLPVTSLPEVRDEAGTLYQQELSDYLELDYWREPPPFVAVADPVYVRQRARVRARGARPLNARQVALLMDDVGADLGVLIEVIEVTVTNQRVRRETRRSRDRNGDMVEWQLERGDMTHQVRAEVLIVDGDGDQLERWTDTGWGHGSFERGVYDGNPGGLRLSRNEARYFDRDVMEEQDAEARAGALEELAEELAERVFSEVLSRVR